MEVSALDLWPKTSTPPAEAAEVEKTCLGAKEPLDRTELFLLEINWIHLDSIRLIKCICISVHLSVASLRMQLSCQVTPGITVWQVDVGSLGEI